MKTYWITLSLICLLAVSCQRSTKTPLSPEEMFAEQTPVNAEISALTRTFHDTHGSWPASLVELEKFASDSRSAVTTDWSRCKSPIFRPTEEGGLLIEYRFAASWGDQPCSIEFHNKPMLIGPVDSFPTDRFRDLLNAGDYPAATDIVMKLKEEERRQFYLRLIQDAQESRKRK